MLLVVSGGIMTSCSDLLDLSPIDFYGSGSYWTTEAQVTGYMDGLHKHLRDVAEQHIFTSVSYTHLTLPTIDDV